MTGKIIGQERTFALLGVTEVRPAQVRAACTVLAGLAIDAADGDSVAAREILRQPLEAIGAIPYESPERLYGRAVRARRRKEDPAP